MNRVHKLAPAFIALHCVACGGGGNTAANQADAGAEQTDSVSPSGDDGVVDNGAPSTTYPAPHPDFPQVLNRAGGKVLAKPKVYMIYYPGYEFEKELDTFAKGIGATSYWPSATSEYGVGAIEYAGSIELTGETAPAMIKASEIAAFLAKKLDDGAFGTPDANTIYTIAYPGTTTITFGDLSWERSCYQADAFHDDTATASGIRYPYVVLSDCGGGLDALTSEFSQELIDASVDPHVLSNMRADAAYFAVDDAHAAWNLFYGYELGNLCAWRADNLLVPEGFPFQVPSVWSNIAAKKGGDPCAPKSKAVYFNAAPVLTDDVTLDLTARKMGIINSKGVQIAKGASKTIEVDLFSDGDTLGPWNVRALDYRGWPDIDLGTPPTSTTLDFKWDRTTGQNGEKLHLTITVIGGDSMFGKVYPFFIESSKSSTFKGRRQTWPGLVTE